MQTDIIQQIVISRIPFMLVGPGTAVKWAIICENALKPAAARSLMLVYFLNYGTDTWRGQKA